MNIETIINELKKDEELFKLTVLYLKVTSSNKNKLLDLFQLGIKLGEKDVNDAIRVAIKKDKETLNLIKKMAEMEALGNIENPTYEETMETMKEHTAPIDNDLLKKVLKNNR